MSWSPPVCGHMLQPTLNSVFGSEQQMFGRGLYLFIFFFVSSLRHWINVLRGSVCTCQTQPLCIVCQKPVTLDQLPDVIHWCLSVCRKQEQVTDPSLQPLHGYKSILRAPSRSITLTGLLARETTQGDHHKTTRRQAGSHLAMPLKQKLGNRGRMMARAPSTCTNMGHKKHLQANLAQFTRGNYYFRSVTQKRKKNSAMCDRIKRKKKTFSNLLEYKSGCCFH